MKQKFFIFFSCLVLFCLTSYAIFLNKDYINEKSGDVYQFIRSKLSPYYNKEKALIAPLFDELWYQKEYAEKIKETGLEPLDHYMQRGWRGKWQNHCNPNPWFDITIYQKTHFKTDQDPFLNFLTQGATTCPDTYQNINVYTNKDQFIRCFWAIESLLRKKRFTISLFLPKEYEKNIPIFFMLQKKRGLIINFTDQPKSFYESDFIQKSTLYQLNDLKIEKKDADHQPIMNVQYSEDKDYVKHEMYNLWFRKSLIDPACINVGCYTDEPIIYSAIGKDEAEFKVYMKKMSKVFDFLMLNTKMNTSNASVIPGYLYCWVNEYPTEKQFSVSYLLSLGCGGPASYRKQSGFLYSLRKDVFEYEKNITIPTKFYVSRKRMEKYSAEWHKRMLPTDSKKWLYESMFNIAIENTAQEDYFSEKIIDCFMTETVPIYLGCPNIGDYFDTRGIIIITSLDDLKKKLNMVTPQIYEKMKPYILENKKRAEKFLRMKNDTLSSFLRGIYKA
jgi:hypothetical protein